jgi:hypothetical protein
MTPKKSQKQLPADSKNTMNQALSSIPNGSMPSGMQMKEDPWAALPWREDGHTGLRYIGRRQIPSKNSSN